MPLHTDTLERRAAAHKADMLARDEAASDTRQTLLVTLGDLPDDIDDTEAAAIITAAAGGSRAEIGALLGHENPASTTNWRLKRQHYILAAKSRINTLLSGVGRLAMAQLVQCSLQAARVTMRTPIDPSTSDKRLAILARAGRDLASVCQYLDEQAKSEAQVTRCGVDPYRDAPESCKSLTSGLLQLKEIVDVDEKDTPPT